ncbi:xanthine dehydrogenase FAD-binding subunit XdhB [Clostridium botulinum]|uniref:Xanthine dehydrogenase FAD-binding subunit XdhB n=1 Tax=Clostridium botulinum TaxID=1491 RepID=A0A6B4JN89_CLOBO|nr:xanthine dehydrogenase FAD-binding subunit XdhB [Clostridium botulinum]EES50426.1 putative xanthine dehydrogenase, FAD-binding subunit [Clostridium botulinum E1 str. 'BoNT E Beluga']MBY6762159.1 xanthine dehydrogenase FAD-binding subunit XdhB [Clostridium botulinum]MBY6920528.1 xanthine dehydrogenase FAD-binding subunit XdhB [Clostridium botulinum]MCR1131756.1 xanthine dehydrogenase FAD-binding subunit XdhB [Clostridium botulinum]NFH68881.1 xanthine dehydrogenase FAD-binding subunit XdhB [C
MFDINEILEPETLEEALELLDKNKELKIIAGGTDVLIKLHHNKMKEAELLSLRKINGLDEINMLEDKSIEVGAMACFSKIFRDDIVQKYIKILAEGAVSMGGPQVRNMATIGGNVCNGAVSADSAPALFSLNAKLRLKSKNNERIVPIQEFYIGPGRVDIKDNEILTHLIIKKEDYENLTGHYIKFSNRKAMDIAMVSVAVVSSIENDKFKDLRIALGVSAPTPIRCNEAENYARGIEVTEENIEKISELAVKSSKSRNSWRASKDFREHLIKELTKRGIKKTIEVEGEK